MRLTRLGLLVILILALPGCGGSNMTTVTGKVTLDGEPIPEGYIAFLPEGPGKGGGGPITNGEYKVDVQNGKNRVEITASKKMALPAGQTNMYGEKEEVRQYIPDKYNAKTELKEDISGPRQIDFALKTK
jgi:hypothetical protein